jgi:hypothetical protein
VVVVAEEALAAETVAAAETEVASAALAAEAPAAAALVVTSNPQFALQRLQLDTIQQGAAHEND